MRPRRETIRSNEYAYFVSTQTAGRKPFFRHERWARLMLSTLAHYDGTGFKLHAFVVMPDHVHFFCAPAHEQAVPLTNWIRYWKSCVTKKWPRPAEQPLWQTDHWDRQLRREENYAEKWEYVRLNPVRQKLAALPDDWPYQGELNVLNWR